jgi:hypothetical protein
VTGESANSTLFTVGNQVSHLGRELPPTSRFAARYLAGFKGEIHRFPVRRVVASPKPFHKVEA